MGCHSCAEKKRQFAEKVAAELNQPNSKAAKVQANLEKHRNKREENDLKWQIYEAFKNIEVINKNVCLFITGLESSGTRYLTKCLIEMGCVGSSEHVQPLIDNLPSPDTLTAPLVIRMSIPCGGKYNIIEKIEELTNLGYDVHVLNIVRDFWPCLQSSIKNHHIKDSDEKMKHIHKYFEILSKIDKPIYNITYAGLSDHLKYFQAVFGLGNYKTAFKLEDNKYYAK